MYHTVMKQWYYRWLLVVGLVCFVLIPRVVDLGAVRSPDEKRWLANTNGFVTNLAFGRIDQLVQQPHPGITTQWLGALTIRSDNFAVQKLPVVIGQALLILAIGYIFARRWGQVTGIILIIILATNPFLFGHTRVYAMDSLLALCSLATLGLLLLWQQQPSRRYLLAAGFFSAAAILSKLSGIIIIPFITALLTFWAWRYRWGLNKWLRVLSMWILATIVAAVLILPSLAVAPGEVIGDFAELFRSDEYLDAHSAPAWYYLQTILFFSTPVQIVGALVLIFWLVIHIRKDKTNLSLESISILGLFALLFIIEMTLGLKKGDRYILPALVCFDAIAALAIMTVWHLPRTLWRHLAVTITLVAIVWQTGIIWLDYPHQLAYVNPLTRSWFGDRRHGWGEGLDVVGAYLNTKPGAATLTVATTYPHEFANYFIGTTVAVNQHDAPSVDYVIIYRSMLQRGASAWETDVVNQYRSQTPEYVLKLSGIEMAWVYARPSQTK